jgi:YfiR/HmsC-like
MNRKSARPGAPLTSPDLCRGRVSVCGRRAALVGTFAALWLRRASAEDVVVPVRMQAELLAKVAIYDRNFEARNGGRVKVLIVVNPGDHSSRLAGSGMKNVLGSLETIGNLPHEDEIISYTDAPSLAEMCKARKVGILYVTPGFSGQLPAMRAALGSLDLLTVGSIADYVPGGIVLGFDLVSGKAKLLVNLSQARKQHVEFRAEVLKLMRVYE